MRPLLQRGYDVPMAARSAGLLMFRRRGGELEVLLAHPGGPFFARKDAGVWTIPKGEIGDEDALAAAQREFTEETGLTAAGPFLSLGEIRQKSGKRVAAWAFEGDCDPAAIRSNTFTIEWPPRSGQMREFPEVDRAAWLSLATAQEKINPAQTALLDALVAAVRERDDAQP